MADRRTALWCAALLGVPAALTGVAVLWPGPGLADDLRLLTEAVLDDAGLAGVGALVSGRDIRLVDVPTGAEAPALAVVAAVDGVRVVEVAGVAPAQPVPTAAPEPSGSVEDVGGSLAAVLNATPVTFAADSALLDGASADAVARVAALLVAAGGPVTVEGHVADTPGMPEVAQRLSEQRAAVVVDALAAAGVARERITAVGRGATEPLATRAASRRVDIEIR